MATGATFKNKFNNVTTGLFKNNTSGDIGADDARTLVDDIDANYLNFDDDVLDQDDMSSNSATQVPTQQSVKAYVDAAALGIVSSWKAPVKVATAVAGTLATSFENGDTVDGIVLVTADRILIKNQAAATENGIYTVNASGAPTRATDANTAAELEGVAVMVQEGTAGANTTWIQTTDGITLGSSNIVWIQMGTTVPDADATTKGIVELSTPAEDITGTDSVRAVTPAGMNGKFRAKRIVTGADASVQSDDNRLIIFNSATPFNFTLDQLTADTKLTFVNYGAGAVTFVNGSGVTAAGNLTLPAAAGTTYPSALVVYDTLTTPRVVQGGSGSGSVTSVGITLGTTGTDIGVSGSPVTSSGNITVNVPSSSAANRGLLTSTDWSTFNNKQSVSAIDRQAVAISAGTLTLNVNSLREANFDLTTTVSSNFALATSNVTNWVKSRLTLRVTGAVVIDCPSTYRMDFFESSNGRWNTSTQELTLTGVTASPFMLEFVPDGSVVWVFATNRGV